MYYKILYNQARNNIQPINGNKRRKEVVFSRTIIKYKER